MIWSYETWGAKMMHRISTAFLVSAAGLTLVACQQNADAGNTPTEATSSSSADTSASLTSQDPGTTPTASPAQATVPAGCEIMNAYGWAATVNAQPPAKPRLGVDGLVVVEKTGYSIELTRKGMDFNPKIVTLELAVTPPPSGTITNPVISTLKATAAVPDVVRDLEKVVINCGGVKLAEITDIKVLD